MAAESPIALIYGFDGSGYIETSIRAGISIPSGQPGFLALGSDAGTARYIKVSATGVVSVDGSAVTQPVSGTFWQATQPVSIAATVAVSGPLTDTELRASAVPVSVASLPLPAGAATEATLATLLTLAGFQARIPVNGQATMTASIPVAIASNQSAIPINDNSGSITVDGTITANQGTPAASANAWPFQQYDPKSDRIADISLTGAQENADTWRLVGGNHTDSTLDTDEWTPTLVGTGTATVATGILDLGTGTTANSSAIVQSVYTAAFTSGQVNNYLAAHRVGDTGTANNTRRWGCFDVNNGMFFQLSGTTFSVVVRSAGADTTINSGSFNGASSSYALDTNFHIFEVQYTGGTALFIIDRVLVHKYTASTAALNSNTTLRIRAENFNSGGGTANVHLYSRGTSISRLGTMETVRVSQSITDSTQVALTKAIITGRKNDGSYVNAAFDDSGRLIVAPAGATAATRGFVFGAKPYSGSTQVSVEATTYTEQTSNAQRSIVSASANDTSAGTGARTVKITYLKVDGTGPFEETVTMNGTSAVNTTATDICFIEKMEVVTVGSTGTNAGIISLKASTGGGGATIGSIGTGSLAAGGDGRTLWAHHYVPAGKVAHITSVTTGHGLNTSQGSGAVFHLKSLPIGVSNAIEQQISDFIHQYGQASSTPRLYGTAIDVEGPARITAFLLPDAALTVVYLCSFDFFEDDA
jgi:hypothetical protein